MRNVIGSGLIFVSSILSLAATAAYAADNSGGKVFALNAQNGSGEHGTVALKPRGAKTVVEIHLIGAPSSPQPAHIHMGSWREAQPCAEVSADLNERRDIGDDRRRADRGAHGGRYGGQRAQIRKRPKGLRGLR